MKAIITITALLLTFTAHAQGTSAACAKRVVYHRTRIEWSFYEINGRINIVKSEGQGETLSSNDDELSADLEDLETAVASLHKKKSINSRQSKIVAAVCGLDSFDPDSLSDAMVDFVNKSANR